MKQFWYSHCSNLFIQSKIQHVSLQPQPRFLFITLTIVKIYLTNFLTDYSYLCEMWWRHEKCWKCRIIQLVMSTAFQNMVGHINFAVVWIHTVSISSISHDVIKFHRKQSRIDNIFAKISLLLVMNKKSSIIHPFTHFSLALNALYFWLNK